MKKFIIAKYILVFITSIGGVGIFIWFFSVGKMNITEMFISFLALGIFNILLFNVDNVKKLIFESKLAKLIVELRERLEAVSKELPKAKPDLEIQVEENIPVTDEPLKVDVVVSPEVLRLKTTINRVEVIADKAEKLLSGKAVGKSDAHADLTVEKKR